MKAHPLRSLYTRSPGEAALQVHAARRLDSTI